MFRLLECLRPEGSVTDVERMLLACLAAGDAPIDWQDLQRLLADCLGGLPAWTAAGPAPELSSKGHGRRDALHEELQAARADASTAQTLQRELRAECAAAASLRLDLADARAAVPREAPASRQSYDVAALRRTLIARILLHLQLRHITV